MALILFGIVAAWGLFDASNLIRGARATGAIDVKLRDVVDQGGNAAGYLATYLLPFVGLVPADWGDWAAYVVFFIVAALVFIHSDLTFINPTLYLLGHRVVSANAYVPQKGAPDILKSGSPFVVVCRDAKAIQQGLISVVTLSGGLITKNEPKVRIGPPA